MIPLDEDLYAQQVKKRSSDRLSVSYGHGIALRVLGAVQLLAGLMSIGLGVAAICTFASAYDTGYGLWAGFVVTMASLLPLFYTHCRQCIGMVAPMISCICDIVCVSVCDWYAIWAEMKNDA